MLKMYLLVFVFMLIVIQPSFVRTLNSTSLGRLFLLSTIIFCTIQNQMAGLAITMVVISVLNQTGPEYFTGLEEEIEPEEEEDVSSKEDKEMTEKKMITPISSYNIMPIIEPETFEPDAFSGVESFSAF
jgi:hypothetical protein